MKRIWPIGIGTPLTGRPSHTTVHTGPYTEAGYALKHHEQNRLIYLFEPQDTDDKVPFDLNTFKYVPVSQAAEIPGKLKSEIIAILKDAGAIIDGGDL